MCGPGYVHVLEMDRTPKEEHRGLAETPCDPCARKPSGRSVAFSVCTTGLVGKPKDVMALYRSPIMACTLPLQSPVAIKDMEWEFFITCPFMTGQALRHQRKANVSGHFPASPHYLLYFAIPEAVRLYFSLVAQPVEHNARGRIMSAYACLLTGQGFDPTS